MVIFIFLIFNSGGKGCFMFCIMVLIWIEGCFINGGVIVEVRLKEEKKLFFNIRDLIFELCCCSKDEFFVIFKLL